MCASGGENEPISVRNPHSIRPYQHVLEPLYAYLMVAQAQYNDYKFADYYNVGPDDCDCITTGDLVNIFCKKWGGEQRWENTFVGGPHEANFLKLDCSKLKKTFGWKPHWNVETAVEKVVEWTKVYLSKEDISIYMDKQISEFFIVGGK